MMSRVHVSSAAQRCTVLLSCVLAVACGKDRGPAESQIAVRVNQGEISVHQVQAVLQRQPRLIATSGEAAAGRVLEVLIDQELSAQAAASQGLETDPNIIQTLQAVRREALARAYQERVAAKVVNPSSDEVDRYYEGHPALFSQRRLYLLHETAVEASEQQLAKLQPLVASWRSTEDVAKALRDAGLQSSARQLAQAAEDLPQLVLDGLANLPVGQAAMLAHPGGARIYLVLQAQKAPVDRRAASAAITNYLIAERKRQAVNDATKGLRQKAKLEYLGAFVPRAAAGAAPTGAPAASGPK